MDILRRLGLSLSVLLFSFSISAFALFISLYVIIDTPAPLKRALQTSGIYDVLVEDGLKQQAATLDPSLPLSDLGIQDALKKSVPPTFLQSSSEQAIDGIYAWVKGDTPEPRFSIDLTEVKQTFADNVAVYVRQKLEPLPPCIGPIVPPASLDGLLSLTCLPRGTTASQLANESRKEALGSPVFAENNTIDAASLKDEQGRSLGDRLSFIPQLHSYYILSLYILPILMLLCITAIIFWSTSKRAGVKRIGWLLITTGITVMLFAAVGIWLLHNALAIFGTPVSTSDTIQTKFLAIIEMITMDLRVWWFGFGAGYTVLGIILLIIVKLNPPKTSFVMGQRASASQTPVTTQDHRSQ